MMWRLFLLAGLGLPFIALSQISGKVEGYDGDTLVPLAGANIYWDGTDVGTVSDAQGRYTLERTPGSSTLVASFIGYESQSKIIISRKGMANFILPQAGSDLSEVEIIARLAATTVDLKAADLSFKVTGKELRKAACCNLSESFETNASVDISFTDPVSGQKQIEMLGLAGKYALIQRENIPFARGLNTNSGLTHIPGPFVEGLQLTKGLSSVLNGYESMTGQINVEFLKPETAPKFLLNAFANQGGRFELNALGGFDVGQQHHSAILTHYSNSPIAMDRNGDQFADMPTGSQINLMNRWSWHAPGSNWEGQAGVLAIRDERRGGQLEALNPEENSDSLWQFNSVGERLELYGKNGYLFDDNDFHSIGLIYSANIDRRRASFGTRNYDAEQRSFYFNSIYQNMLGSKKHQYLAGISLQMDNITETLTESDLTYYNQDRQEVVPGAYVEYNYEPDPALTLVAGTRIDYNSYFDQVFITPRFNLRYNFTENTTFRIGGGRGQRTPNLVAENFSVLASGRTLDFGTWRGPEIAWNTGASLVQELDLGMEASSFIVDAFYTWFQTKLVTDLDYNRLSAHLINGEGSRSLSLMGQLELTPVERLDIRLAYKYLKAQENFRNGLNSSYFVPEHRAFVNMAYETRNRWKFDLTINWFGSRRLPSSAGAPQEFQRFDWSPDFFTMNAQINKVFENGLELFAGADNVLDFRQLDPIVSAADPSSPYFDANYAWGPVFGRNIYAGLYLTLDRN
jgi:outer membrane receptor for ferrienterochelin and colicins